MTAQMCFFGKRILCNEQGCFDNINQVTIIYLNFIMIIYVLLITNDLDYIEKIITSVSQITLPTRSLWFGLHPIMLFIYGMIISD